MGVTTITRPSALSTSLPLPMISLVPILVGNKTTVARRHVCSKIFVSSEMVDGGGARGVAAETYSDHGKSIYECPLAP